MIASFFYRTSLVLLFYLTKSVFAFASGTTSSIYSGYDDGADHDTDTDTGYDRRVQAFSNDEPNHRDVNSENRRMMKKAQNKRTKKPKAPKKPKKKKSKQPSLQPSTQPTTSAQPSTSSQPTTKYSPFLKKDALVEAVDAYCNDPSTYQTTPSFDTYG